MRNMRAGSATVSTRIGVGLVSELDSVFVHHRKQDNRDVTSPEPLKSKRQV